MYIIYTCNMHHCTKADTNSYRLSPASVVGLLCMSPDVDVLWVFKSISDQRYNTQWHMEYKMQNNILPPKKQCIHAHIY